jgi:antitoxin (DNA-binding transcriptional repressor) of toxin-antitoxin stability system
MQYIGAFEAKNTLGALLDRVEKGEEIVITRHGKPVARMVREDKIRDRQTARDAANAIIARSKGVRLAGLSVKALIEEGRR